MEATRREGLKQSFLLAFIALNVLLIILIWAENLSDDSGNSGFVRITARPSATYDFSAPQTGEPEATHQHKNERNPTPGQPTKTPAPTRDSGDIGFLPHLRIPPHD